VHRRAGKARDRRQVQGLFTLVAVIIDPRPWLALPGVAMAGSGMGIDRHSRTGRLRCS
jgi:hypothetical protein